MIDAFTLTSRYLDDLLNIDNILFEQIGHRIYPAELQLDRANASDTEAAFLDLNLSIHNDTVSTKIYEGLDRGVWYSLIIKNNCPLFTLLKIFANSFKSISLFIIFF